MSPAAKKNVLSFAIAPPTDADPCLSLSGMSTGLIDVRLSGLVQVGIEGGQNRSVVKAVFCHLPGRSMKSASPRRLFVPVLVTMFIAGPAVKPNSALNALESTFT